MEEKLFSFREMTREDVPRVAEIELDSFTVPWSESSFRAIFGYENLHAIVALSENTVIGYAVFSNIFEDGEILNIACDKTFRKQGAAASLMSLCETAMKEKGVLNVFLEVRQSNTPARNLYKKLAYKEVGFRKNYYKNPIEDAILMRKELTQLN